MKLTIATVLIVFISLPAAAEDVVISRIYQKKRDFHYYTVNFAAWYTITSPARQKVKDVGIHDPKYCVDSGDVFIASDEQLPGTFQLIQWRDRGGHELLLFAIRRTSHRPRPLAQIALLQR